MKNASIQWNSLLLTIFIFSACQNEQNSGTEDSDSSVDIGTDTNADSETVTETDTETDTEYVPPDPCTYNPAVFEEIYSIDDMVRQFTSVSGGILMFSSASGFVFLPDGDSDPVAIADANYTAHGILDGDNLFILDSAANTISRISVSSPDAAPELIYGNQEPVDELYYTRDGDYLYFRTAPSDAPVKYNRMPLTGGAPEEWWALPTENDTIQAIREGYVYYWRLTNPGHPDELYDLLRAPLDGGAEEVVLTDRTSPNVWTPNVMIEKTHLYLSESDGLYAMNLDGSGRRKIFAPENVVDVTELGDQLFWSTNRFEFGFTAADGESCEVYYALHPLEDPWHLWFHASESGVFVIDQIDPFDPTRILRMIP